MNEELIKYKFLLNNPKHPKGDFYVNIPLYVNNNKYDEYVNLDKDPTKTIIDRGNFNPFYIELGFFSSIKTAGSDDIDTENSNYENSETIYNKSKTYQITINK